MDKDWDEIPEEAMGEYFKGYNMKYDNTDRGVAFVNDYKKEDKHPDFKGRGNFNGQDFEFGMWRKENAKGEYFSFSFSEPYKKESLQSKENLPTDEEVDKPIDLSEIPFN